MHPATLLTLPRDGLIALIEAQAGQIVVLAARIAERTAMYQMTAMSTGQPLNSLPDRLRRRHLGPWGDKIDARLHLDAWRRVLDREEPDYAR